MFFYLSIAARKFTVNKKCLNAKPYWHTMNFEPMNWTESREWSREKEGKREKIEAHTFKYTHTFRIHKAQNSGSGSNSKQYPFKKYIELNKINNSSVEIGWINTRYSTAPIRAKINKNSSNNNSNKTKKAQRAKEKIQKKRSF